MGERGGGAGNGGLLGGKQFGQGGLIDMKGRIRETGLKQVRGDREPRIVGISRQPEVLEPESKPLGRDEREEDAFGVVPNMGEPEGRIFWREGNHKLMERKGKDGGLGVGERGRHWRNEEPWRGFRGLREWVRGG